MFFLVANDLENRHLIIIEVSSQEKDTSGLMQTECYKVDTFVEVFLSKLYTKLVYWYNVGQYNEACYAKRKVSNNS